MAALTPERNDHHGLPRSWGGSSCSENITRMYKDRHDAFHGILGHRPPDFSARTLVLASILSRKPALPAGVTGRLLEEFTPADWRMNYLPRALRDRRREPSTALLGSAMHLANHLHHELQMVMQAINLVHWNQRPGEAAQAFNDRADEFFDTQDPGRRLRRFLTEVDGTDFSWTKPLRPSLRSYAARLADEGAEMPGAAMVSVLMMQRRRLLQAALEWQPQADLNVFQPDPLPVGQAS